MPLIYKDLNPAQLMELLPKLKLNPEPSATGCFLWAHSDRSDFTPTVRLFMRSTTAARYIYQECIRPVPRNHSVIHTCGDVRCCNPLHLELVSNSFLRSGERHSRTKLSNIQVIQIRERREGGESLKSLAAAFNVSVPTISSITCNKTWTHLL